MSAAPQAVGTPSDNGRARYRDIRQVTLIGAVVNAVIATLKLLFGMLAHSQSLLADGLHSLSDLASDILLIVAAKHSTRDADADHPYGHARIETVFSVVQGLILGGFALSIGFDAVRRLLNPELLLSPQSVALYVALVSVVAKESLYHYTARAARRLRSSMLRGNAWDHRSDAISSVIVIIGVGGTLAGFKYMDALAAAGVALMIIKISWDLIWQALRELIDTGLEAERVDAIYATLMGVTGVNACHMLRTRKMGPDALVDVHILVDPTLSVSEGHQISETVRHRLIAEIEEVSDVMVHIDPEDDERSASCSQLPERAEVLRRLHGQWQDIAAAPWIEEVRLHYLDGKVHVELLLPLDLANTRAEARALAEQFRHASQRLPEIGAVEVHFR